MHPQIAAMIAAERVKDMHARADRGRRAREARRARRGAITVLSADAAPAHRAGELASQQPCPQLPCPPLTAARAA